MTDKNLNVTQEAVEVVYLQTAYVKAAQEGFEVSFGNLYLYPLISAEGTEIAFGNLYPYLFVAMEGIEVAWTNETPQNAYTHNVRFGLSQDGISVHGTRF